MLKGKTEQIAYFDAYHGHIHNPGMGIVSMAVSDHMITGYTKEARTQGDARKPFVLTQKMLDEVAPCPISTISTSGWAGMMCRRSRESFA